MVVTYAPTPGQAEVGIGGDLQMQIPHPWRQRHVSPTNSYCLSLESLTIWPSMAIHVANAPTLEEFG